MAFQRFTKDPDAVLDYEWDWSDWLAPVTDTIATAEFIADDGIVVDSFAHNGTAAIAWISGGVAGTSYNVTCRIVTTEGRANDRTCTFKVANL